MSCRQPVTLADAVLADVVLAEIMLADAHADIRSCEQDRVPEGRLTIARRFNAGYAGTNIFRPVGTAETSYMTLREVRPWLK
jgi:hypothetical protein